MPNYAGRVQYDHNGELRDTGAVSIASPPTRPTSVRSSNVVREITPEVVLHEVELVMGDDLDNCVDFFGSAEKCLERLSNPKKNGAWDFVKGLGGTVASAFGVGSTDPRCAGFDSFMDRLTGKDGCNAFVNTANAVHEHGWAVLIPCRDKEGNELAGCIVGTVIIAGATWKVSNLPVVTSVPDHIVLGRSLTLAQTAAKLGGRTLMNELDGNKQ